LINELSRTELYRVSVPLPEWLFEKKKSVT